MVTATSDGTHELALTMVAFLAAAVSSAQRLCQRAHVPKQILVRRKPPNLSLTISKGGDVSQVLSADLRNILHHKDLPGQLIQEVSCHEWCFTGEHNLLVKSNRKRRKGVTEPKRKLRRKQKNSKTPGT